MKANTLLEFYHEGEQSLYQSPHLVHEPWTNTTLEVAEQFIEHGFKHVLIYWNGINESQTFQKPIQFKNVAAWSATSIGSLNLLYIVDDATDGKEEYRITAYKFMADTRHRMEMMKIWSMKNVGTEFLVSGRDLVLQRCAIPHQTRELILVDSVTGELSRNLIQEENRYQCIPCVIANGILFWLRSQFYESELFSILLSDGRTKFHDAGPVRGVESSGEYYYTNTHIIPINEKKKKNRIAAPTGQYIVKSFRLMPDDYLMSVFVSNGIQTLWYYSNSKWNNVVFNVAGRIHTANEQFCIQDAKGVILHGYLDTVNNSVKKVTAQIKHVFGVQEDFQHQGKVMEFDKDKKAIISIVYPSKGQELKGVITTVYSHYGHITEYFMQPRWYMWLRAGYAWATIGIPGSGDNGDKLWLAGRGVNRTKAHNIMQIALKQVLSMTNLRASQQILFGRSAAGMKVARTALTEINHIGMAYMEAPFLDVVASQSNPELPYTALSYTEDGDPSKPDYRKVLEEMDPTILLETHTPRTPMLVHGSANDTQVYANEWKKWQQLVKKTGTDVPYKVIIEKKGGHFVLGEEGAKQKAADAAWIISHLH